jgi:hypothetical protein
MRVCASSFPVLFDIERPLELEMGVVVIVDKFGDGFVVAAAEHAGWSGFGFNYRRSEHTEGCEGHCAYISSRSMASPRC